MVSLPDLDIRSCKKATKDDVAYLHHTSGTSTGLPKPIAQTHFAAVGVLPCLGNSSLKATFTTTPLYHGGIADCFRAWTSGALVWLFPGKEVPITTENVLRCLDCAVQAQETHKAPGVTYFSSVPYVLQMIAAESAGLHALAEMDIVGVGGAALPQSAGDDLVRKGVNLISRFGSAECGFLMSSHRIYEKDKEWQYLRTESGSEALKFEANEEGLSELIILPMWPHMAKRNRLDQSFATADLFAPHPTISNAWKYHSRADSQITLITGKKFDPAPLEAAIGASSLLSDVVVFGNDRPFPGALLFPSTATRSWTAEQLTEKIWPEVIQINNQGQAHTRISAAMLLVMDSNVPSLEKSSKGTILRSQAEKRFASEIDGMYEIDGIIEESEGRWMSSVSDHEMPKAVSSIIKMITGRTVDIPDDADLFSQGVDSVACIQIRATLQKTILAPGSPKLPLNVIYSCGTIEELSNYLLGVRHGKANKIDDEIQSMRELVQRYDDLASERILLRDVSNISSIASCSRGEVVILTGATGTLGAHILDQLRSYPSISEVVCLVRAADQTAAYSRVNKSLSQRHKAALAASSQPKVTCLVSKLGCPNLGLDESTYASLASSATLIIHSAWAVNFSMRLRSFVKDHIQGLHNLITLALHSTKPSPPRFVFCSSTASVLGPTRNDRTSSPIPEAISLDPEGTSPLGYSRSKWVAEAICSQAHQHSRLQNRISVVRIGQLCGDTHSGIWNVTEAWPLMLSSVSVTGALPDLKGEKLSWLPVDIAARAVLEIALRSEEDDVQGIEGDKASQDKETKVYHLVNQHAKPTWSDLLLWMRDLSTAQFDIIEPREWVNKLENLKGKDALHPARKLLGLWQSAYCDYPAISQKAETDNLDVTTDHNANDTESREENISFAMEKTKRVAPTMRDVQPLSREHFEKIWVWIEKEMIAGNGPVVGT